VRGREGEARFGLGLGLRLVVLRALLARAIEILLARKMQTEPPHRKRRASATDPALPRN
jgi:hypothetical protein